MQWVVDLIIQESAGQQLTDADSSLLSVIATSLRGAIEDFYARHEAEIAQTHVRLRKSLGKVSVALGLSDQGTSEAERTALIGESMKEITDGARQPRPSPLLLEKLRHEGTPLVLAEDLSSAAIADRLEHHTAFGASYPSLSQAWDYVELGIADPKLSDQAFAEARQLFAARSEQEGSLLEKDYFQARLGLIFEPALRKRAARQAITPDVINVIYQDLAVALQELMSEHDKVRAEYRGHLAELLALALSARGQDIAFPASPREEGHNNSVGRKRYNHDCYKIRRHKKIPLQAKYDRTSRGHGYDESVLSLYMKRVIGVPVAKRLALEHPGFARRSPDERRERALVLVAQSVTVDARRRSEQPSFRAPLLDVATKALAEKINAFATRIV